MCHDAMSLVTSLNLRISGAVTFLFVKAFAALLLVGDYGVSFNMPQDLGFNCSFIASYGKFSAGIYQQYFQGNGISGDTGQLGYVEGLVLLYFELLSGYFYNCYHNKKLGTQR
jgi:hypothetical protein